MNILAKMQGGGGDGRVFVTDGKAQRLIIKTCTEDGMLSEEYLRSSLENFNVRAGMLEVVFSRTANEATISECDGDYNHLPQWVSEAILNGFNEQGIGHERY